MKTPSIVILGIFVADTAYRAARQPRIGETILGDSFVLGPGGKGSNQAVAAARLGAAVSMISRLGQDPFAQMALDMWKAERIRPAIQQDAESYTGAAYIFIESTTGNNAIIVAPGAAAKLTAGEVRSHRALIAEADIFMTQLEQPIPAAFEGLKVAREARVMTILNPAPAASVGPDLLGLCDYITPNETEAEAITGIPVRTTSDAEAAARKLRSLGAGDVIITLGEGGAALLQDQAFHHVPAVSAGDVVETTGAGDSFNGAFAYARALGQDALEAVRFANAAAAISVTRPGTAPSMPKLADVEALLKRT